MNEERYKRALMVRAGEYLAQIAGNELPMPNVDFMGSLLDALGGADLDNLLRMAVSLGKLQALNDMGAAIGGIAEVEKEITARLGRRINEGASPVN